MAGNPSVKKRQKEAARQDRQKEKALRREQRRAARAARDTTDGAEDPDLAGIVAGPQPLPEEA